jgi:hypothetical protein
MINSSSRCEGGRPTVGLCWNNSVIIQALYHHRSREQPHQTHAYDLAYQHIWGSQLAWQTHQEVIPPDALEIQSENAMKQPFKTDTHFNTPMRRRVGVEEIVFAVSSSFTQACHKSKKNVFLFSEERKFAIGLRWCFSWVEASLRH